MLAILERGGMLSYWGRDILLIQKAKTGFNDLSTHTSHKKKKKKSEYGKEVQNKWKSYPHNTFSCF